MISDRQQTVGIRRKIDADDLGLLVDNVINEPRVLMAEAVVVLPPDVARQEVVQRADRTPPGNVAAYLQPLGVLVEHRIDDVDERLIAREEAVPAGQEIALVPALALVLAKHLHHPPVGRQMIVPGKSVGDPGTIGDLKGILPAVRVVLVRTEKPEISFLHVQLHHIAKEPAHDSRGFGRRGAGCGHLDGVVTEIREAQFAEQQAAIRVRVGAHAASASRGKFGQF